MVQSKAEIISDFWPQQYRMLRVNESRQTLSRQIKLSSGGLKITDIKKNKNARKTWGDGNYVKDQSKSSLRYNWLLEGLDSQKKYCRVSNLWGKKEGREFEFLEENRERICKIWNMKEDKRPTHNISNEYQTKSTSIDAMK